VYDETGAGGLLADVGLIAGNATLYNGAESEYHAKGQKLLKAARNLVAQMDSNLLVSPAVRAPIEFDSGNNKGSTLPTAAQREHRRKMRGLLKSFVVLDKNLDFRDPVDVKEVEDYLDLIKSPMDFRTMEERLEQGAYDSTGSAGLLADVELIAENAGTYNGVESEYYEKAMSILQQARSMVQALDAALAHALATPLSQDKASQSLSVKSSSKMAKASLVPSQVLNSNGVNGNLIPSPPSRPTIAQPCSICHEPDVSEPLFFFSRSH